MGKDLAIKGHPTRGKEIIELLKMLGGDNRWKASGEIEKVYYSISNGAILYSPQIAKDTVIFTLEEFLEKYPFKVGDKVQVLKSGKVFTIGNMIWDDEVCDIYYYNTDDIEYYNVEELKLYKETDTVKPITNKSERTHEDVIFDSIIWHLRNSVNNGKQNLSGGECEDYFREVVKKNIENKMSDCKKCGLVFGSVRCFDKDCPHNTPKSYTVGLKDGKVIECGVNKEIVMNEIKPLFKTGDVVKLKGCPDKNIFWIVMDVIEDEYIFNSGEKCSFDDQHHYEKSNREVMLTAPPEFATLNMSAIDYNNGLVGYEIPEGYEFDTVIDNKVVLKKLKPTYPKLTNLSECKEILGEKDMYQGVSGYKGELLTNFQRLLIFRDAYWKIAGEELGLDKPWEPDWLSGRKEEKYCIATQNNEIWHNFSEYGGNEILAFPTKEMRDAFYDNFKDLIEQCKELL